MEGVDKLTRSDKGAASPFKKGKKKRKKNPLFPKPNWRKNILVDVVGGTKKKKGAHHRHHKRMPKQEARNRPETSGRAQQDLPSLRSAGPRKKERQ